MRKPWYSFLYVNTTVGKVLWGIASLLLMLVLFFGYGLLEERRMAAHTGNWEGRAIEKGAEIYAANCYTCHGVNGEGSIGRAPALNSHYFFAQRTADIGFPGSQRDFISSTVAAGRPANAESQWLERMATWGAEFGGPLRQDQIDAVTEFIMNWESTALLQTPEEDPWIPFENAPTTGISVTVTTASEPADGAIRDPETLFTAMACAGCHNLTEVQSQTNRGPIGPHLGDLAALAQAEAPDMTPEEFVHESIVDPNAHVAAGYNTGMMPTNFGERMSEEEIQGLVAWLLDPSQH